MKLAIGCDHIVTFVKNEVIKYLETLGHTVVDMGTFDNERTHYPIYGHKVGIAVAKKEVDFGVVICGTGVGISNGSQKTKGTRTVLVRDVITAKEARRTLDANVVGFGGRITGVGLIGEIIEAFISTKYEKTKENDNNIERINKIITKENFNTKMFDVELERWDCGYYHD